jgi:hypothetical protein
LDPTVESVVARLEPYTKTLAFTTESPAESKAKRLRRILGALRGAIAEGNPNPGDEVGSRLRDVLLSTFRPNETPENTREDLTNECFGFVHDVIRLKFALATFPSTYSPCRTAKHWYQPSEWEMYVESSPSARAVAQDVESALEILARAGLPDNSLFDYLTVLVGDEQRARRRTADILRRNPSLQEDVADWLSGRVAPRRSSSLATSSQYQKADELIADLLIQQNALGSGADRIHNDVLPRIKILEEQSAVIVEAWMSKVRGLTTVAVALADLRGLSLVGTVGEIVSFSPAEHELTDPRAFGGRRVRLVRPMAVADTGGERRRVIRKALVEPCD